jgi:DNA-binding NarL/FixJ family response regulator
VPEKLSVLLIEDDVHDVEAVERAFRTVQPSVFELKHVPKFRDAIRLIQAESFHVVILDLGLPDSVGLNGVERLMKLIPTVPVIVLTGIHDEETSLRGIELGAQEFLDKNSVTPKQLIRTIRHATKRKQYWIQELANTNQRSGVRPPKTTEKPAIEKLTTIMKETSDLVTARTATLLETELTEQQRSIVSEIKQKTQQSMASVQAIGSGPYDIEVEIEEPIQQPRPSRAPIVGKPVEE